MTRFVDTPIRKNLFADESGNFDFSRKKGATRYFILAAVTLVDCLEVNARFNELRHQMAWEGHDHPGPFHAANDPAPVRDRVFGVIEALDFRIDSLILEKAKAMPHVGSCLLSRHRLATRRSGWPSMTQYGM